MRLFAEQCLPELLSWECPPLEFLERNRSIDNRLGEELSMAEYPAGMVVAAQPELKQGPKSYVTEEMLSTQQSHVAW